MRHFLIVAMRLLLEHATSALGFMHIDKTPTISDGGFEYRFLEVEEEQYESKYRVWPAFMVPK